MKIRTALITILLFSLVSSCQAATPEPITAVVDTEFTLSVGQTVLLSDTNLTIKLLSVLSDERCPSEIECAASGPATLRLSMRNKDGVFIEENLQTFTDNKGLAPTMEFEGIKSSTVVDEYQIKILGVLPYPKTRSSTIKPSEYKVTLKVSRNE